MVVVDYGIDLDASLSFSNGDLKLAEYETNIAQAIGNRLNTLTDELDIFYEDYGSVLRKFFGWHKVDETLKFIKIELDTVIAKDPRVTSFSTSVEYIQKGVRIHIEIDSEGEILDLNYILTGENVELVEEEI